MSGGYLTDYGRYSISAVDEWAEKIEPQNALFAEQLRAMRKMLDAYDLFMSGDIGEDKLTAEWTAYAAKWLDFDTKTVGELVKGILEKVAEGITNGCRKGEERWDTSRRNAPSAG